MEFGVDLPTPYVCRLLEDEHTLVDVAPPRTDVQRQRIAEGWTLVSSRPAIENAQDLIEDLWTRTMPLPSL